MSDVPTKPSPVPDEWSGGYWAAAAEHVLALPRCSRCRSYVLPPGPVCPYCQSTDPDFQTTPISGRGTVRSWTIVRDAFLPAFRDDLPYVLVDVELEEQTELRMIGRLVDGADAPLRIGDHVVVTFDDIGPGVSVPAFALAP